MKLLAGFLAAALAQDSDRWGYYDYYGNSVGKSQTSQTGINGQLNASGQAGGTLGNGRICWQCAERSYGECLAGSASNGDPVRHGAAFCTGEEYFCFISERRTIRHEGNDLNFEQNQPWSSNTNAVYQEENINHASSNMTPNTAIRVEMGCQQPMACLRQQNMNFQIQMGNSFFFGSGSVPGTGLPVAHSGLAREGSCRLGKDWVDYMNGMTDTDNWRMDSWQSGISDVDRRYGAVENHYHFGKGTESVCHYCCDPLLEFSAGDSDPTTPYDYMGCNFNAVSGGASDITTSGNVDTGDLAGNAFLVRQHNWLSPVWYNSAQYHGTFRNPHTQYPHKTMSHNTGSTPNGRR